MYFFDGIFFFDVACCLLLNAAVFVSAEGQEEGYRSSREED
jgi:hypothetical protein